MLQMPNTLEEVAGTVGVSVGELSAGCLRHIRTRATYAASAHIVVEGVGSS